MNNIYVRVSIYMSTYACICIYIYIYTYILDMYVWVFICQHMHVYVFTNPSAPAGCNTRSIFKWSLPRSNSEFSFSKTSCLTSSSYNIPIAGGRITGFIPFPRVLELCEMQSGLTRIWTRVAVSISFDYNHYTTGNSNICESM